MKHQAYNPYLPFWETVPDAEPHVFGDRLYIYGSHDKMAGESFCVQDYVCWSAPVNDLADWRYEGVIYKKAQDPLNGAPYEGKLPEYQLAPWDELGKLIMQAPDVVQGPDGRYYLYYALGGINAISMAVSDFPAGPFSFVDYVRYEDLSVPEQGNMFDPAIYCDETGNYLYYGFAPSMGRPVSEEEAQWSMVMKLADDMHTVISKPIRLVPGQDAAAGTEFEEHPFFEASSIRKFGEKFYFVYSSSWAHELCYATGDSPEGPFHYQGVVVSNGDVGLNGNQLPVNYMGNNHGGLVEVNGKYYIFWHRQTHGTSFSRQGCADEVQILPDGTIEQTEITSCGLNGGPLKAEGKYPSYIACHLTEGDRKKVDKVLFWMDPKDKPELPEEWPYITEEADETGEHGLKPFIKNMRKGATAGFKYFLFAGEKQIEAELRGKGEMSVRVDSPDGKEVARIQCDTEKWQEYSTDLADIEGTHALYFVVEQGILDFGSFGFLGKN